MTADSALNISSQEILHLTNSDLEKFWLSRLRKKDPVARIGYALWCKTTDDLKAAIQRGPASFWDYKRLYLLGNHGAVDGRESCDRPGALRVSR